MVTARKVSDAPVIQDAMRLLLALVVLLLAAGCPARSIGQPCTLIKPDGDGGTTALLEGDVAVQRDYLSFGVAECTAGICLRDAQYVQTGDTSPTAPALGYCTESCSNVGQTCSGNVGSQPLTCQAYGLTFSAIEAACDAGSSAPCGATAELSSPNLCAE
jgi:hypothetical protein